jgi:hypothetical protein
VRTASVSQVRQPIYQRSVARWKHYEQPLGPLFDRLGDAAATSTTETNQREQKLHPPRRVRRARVMLPSFVERAK